MSLHVRSMCLEIKGHLSCNQIYKDFLIKVAIYIQSLVCAIYFPGFFIYNFKGYYQVMYFINIYKCLTF